MKKTPLIALAGAATLVALLAGCSGQVKTGTTDDIKPHASKSSSAKSDSAAPDALPTNECTDGQLTVTDVKSSKAALAKGCDAISLLTNAEHVKIGPTKLLGIEGSDNVVTGAAIETVHAMGTGNKVTYTGAAPDT